LSDEQLRDARQQAADALVSGVRGYRHEKVEEASAHLAAIQRELEARAQVPTPAKPRGAVEGDVTYATELDDQFKDELLDRLEATGDGLDMARVMFGTLRSPEDGSEEERLQYLERLGLFNDLSRRIRTKHGEFHKQSDNPYTTNSPETLAQMAEKLREAIATAASEGRTQHVDQFRQNLAQVEEVMRNRAEA
jgi:hypothetical protein